MTKGGSTKSKTLGRLIFGEKRKQHASPSRHRSTTRNAPKSGSNVDLSTPKTSSSPPPPPIIPPRTPKKSINLHDWSLWRIQLNEQLATILNERQADLRELRPFLQKSSFYRKENRDENDGQLLFSIPRAKFRPEDLENVAPPVVVPPSEVSQAEIVNYEPIPIVPPPPSRSAARSSFVASDRIHSTLQKTVKDGNVLEKIKAFEMQAAAAAAQSASCVSSRIQSVTSSIRSIPPVQIRRDEPIEIPTNQSAKNSRNFVEAAQGDVILRRRTPSPCGQIEDEDISITAISSMPLKATKEQHRIGGTLRLRQKRTTTPRRRWLKSGEKQEILIVKKKKKKNTSDNQRVYGVPDANSENLDSIQTAVKIESDDDLQDQTNTYDDERGENFITTTLQRRSMTKNRKKLSSTDAEDRLTRTIDRQADQSELDDEQTDGNVFIEDSPRKSRSNRRKDEIQTPVNDVPNGNATKKKQRACVTNPPTKQMSKQILHAIMNSIHPNHHHHHQHHQQDAVNAEFFDNGPLTNPEET